MYYMVTHTILRFKKNEIKTFDFVNSLGEPFFQSKDNNKK